MAVIRQQTQVFNKPVGVRRINTGEAELWEQVAAQANEFSNRAFKKAAVEANKIGAEKAMSLSSSDIVALDPKTNQPKVYQPPEEYGEIAASSFQEIINARFEESVDKELAAQGAHYAKFARNADHYNELISSHVASMINADGEDTYFSRYINESGTAYASKTYTSMKAEEIENSRKSILLNDLTVGYNHMASIKEAVTSGTTSHLDVLENLDIERARSERLKNTGGLTFPQYTQRMEKIDSLQLLSAHTSLAQQYAEFDSVQQKEFLSLLSKPETIQNFELRQLTIDALLDTKPETLANALENSSVRTEEYIETAKDNYTTLLIPKLSSVTTVEQINELVKGVPVDTRAAVKESLLTHYISMKIDFASDDEEKINNLQLELNKPNPDVVSLTELLDQHQIQRNELFENTGELAQFIIDMDVKGRGDLVKYLTTKATFIRTRDSLVIDKVEKKIQNNLRNMATSQDPVNDYTKFQKAILNGKFKDQQSKLDSLGTIFGHTMNRLARQRNVSYNELIKIKGMLENPTLHDEAALSDDGKYVLTAYRNAFDDIPTVVNRSIQARLNDIKREIDTNLTNKRLNIIGITMEGQGQVPEDDLKFYQDQVYGENLLINSSNIKMYEELFQELGNNNMFPAVKTYFENVVNSQNEDDINTAASLWSQYTNAQTTSAGTPYVGDRLKNKISKGAYNKLAAAHYTAKKEGILPSTAMFELNAYEGNVEQDILIDLSKDNKKYKNLIRYFDDKNMSANYKAQIIAGLKMAKARGNIITDEYVNEYIQDYTKDISAKADSNVIAPTIDGAVEYAISSHISKTDFLESVGNLTDALIASNPDSPLLGETTTFDQIKQGFRDILGINAGLLVGTVLESMGFQEGSYDASANLYNQERVRQGYDTLIASIVWKPDTVSFANGQPKYIAGFINDFDRWEEIPINGEQYTLIPSDEEGKAKDRFVTYQQHGSALMSPDLSVRSKSFIEVLASREFFKSYEQLKLLDEYPQLLQVYTEEQIKEIFDARKELSYGDNN